MIATETVPPALYECLLSTHRLVVLTGAGVSAESGIPTFRDAQTGLWAQYDPLTLASPEGFADNPALVWDWYEWRRGLIAAAKPNPGHHALVDMAGHFEHFRILTQNVDGLHQQAGSERVIELHGNIRRTICSKTRRTIEPEWIERHSTGKPPPSPYADNGLARPDVVWFGEALDRAMLESAMSEAGHCELMIVAGTAGVVQPAASLPILARQAGARLVDINPEPNDISRIADWQLQGTSAEWLPRIAGCLATAGSSS